MRWPFLFPLFLVTCAGTQARDVATQTTNALGLALERADARLAPALARELAEADARYPNDQAAYKLATQAPLRLYTAFEDVRDAQRWMHLALELWDTDSGAMWADVAPCAVEALDHVLAQASADDLRVLREALHALTSEASTCRRFAEVSP